MEYFVLNPVMVMMMTTHLTQILEKSVKLKMTMMICLLWQSFWAYIVCHTEYIGGRGIFCLEPSDDDDDAVDDDDNDGDCVWGVSHLIHVLSNASVISDDDDDDDDDDLYIIGAVSIMSQKSLYRPDDPSRPCRPKAGQGI